MIRNLKKKCCQRLQHNVDSQNGLQHNPSISLLLVQSICDHHSCLQHTLVISIMCTMPSFCNCTCCAWSSGTVSLMACGIVRLTTIDPGKISKRSEKCMTLSIFLKELSSGKFHGCNLIHFYSSFLARIQLIVRVLQLLIFTYD